jgi:hypothetical protein
VAHVVGPLLRLVASPIDFFFSWSSISPKIDIEFFLGSFDVRKVPESKKTCKNKKICFAVLKPNKRGLF